MIGWGPPQNVTELHIPHKLASPLILSNVQIAYGLGQGSTWQGSTNALHWVVFLVFFYVILHQDRIHRPMLAGKQCGFISMDTESSRPLRTVWIQLV